jgi:hypothetical protein
VEFILLIGLIWVVICLIEQNYDEVPPSIANVMLVLVVWAVVVVVYALEKGYANGMG